MAREAFGGFELGLGGAGDGFAGGALATDNTSTYQHTDVAGNGGTYTLTGTGNSGNDTAPNGIYTPTNAIRELTEVWYRGYLYFNTSSASRDFTFTWFNSGTELGHIRFVPNTGTISIYTSTTTLQASSSTGAFPTFSVFRFEIRVRIADVGGLIEVYVNDNGTYTSPKVSFSGDTKPGADTTIDSFGVGILTTAFLDDWCVNSITLKYDGLTGGTFSAGDTITAAGGGSATVTSDEVNGTEGVLVIHNWNGTDFINNESFDNGGGVSGSVDAPNSSYVYGLEPNSWGPGDGFVVALVPNANGATTQLSGSDGNQTNNYELVDEIPPDDNTSYVYAVADGEFDTYGMSNLPASADTINSVNVVTWASKDGAVINNVEHMLRISSTDYSGSAKSLPVSYDNVSTIFDLSPATADSFTASEINSLEAGLKFKS